MKEDRPGQEKGEVARRCGQLFFRHINSPQDFIRRRRIVNLCHQMITQNGDNLRNAELPSMGKLLF
jgi:hypothetical protein